MAIGDLGSTPCEIQIHRGRFLQAVEGIKQANDEFNRLALAAGDLTGAPLDRFITNWAIKCHLADRTKRWWIVDHIAKCLKQLADGPPNLVSPGSVDDDAVEAEHEKMEREFRLFRMSYASVEIFSSLPQELPFRLYEFDTKSETLDEWKAEARDEFEKYLGSYAREQSQSQVVPKTREPLHYEWLVRYQMLGSTWNDIGMLTESHADAGTIKAAVLALRRRIDLPQRQRCGRPRKL